MPTGDKVLGNKIRRMIYKLIVNYPGVPFNKLMDIFELTDSNLRYHLNYLEKNGKISSGVDDGVKHYYPHPSTVRTLEKSQDLMEAQRFTTHSAPINEKISIIQ